jgi:hypothetical protein
MVATQNCTGTTLLSEVVPAPMTADPEAEPSCLADSGGEQTAVWVSAVPP